MIDLDVLPCKYNILFNGRADYIPVLITAIIRDHMGHPIWLESPDDTIYNWSNIQIMRKAR